MGKSLIIFLDSFPYSSLSKAKFLSSFDNPVKVTPGFGYSINVKAEIFGGYRPDDVGFLNEWMYSPDGYFRKRRHFLRVLSPVSRVYLLDRAMRRLILKLCQLNTLYIPFKYLPFFDRFGTEAYKEGFRLPTVLSRMRDLRKITYADFPHSSRRDEQVFVEARKAIASQASDNLFVCFADLDHLTHVYGVGSREHDAKIAELDGYLQELCSEFSRANEHAALVIVSDHGMANVERSVQIDMEARFGEAGERSYLYFKDATMLRVWTFCENKKREIVEFLRDQDFGTFVGSHEREVFGITSRRFGDIIFLLNEGTVFNPSFFGKRAPKAMHGYHPSIESQKGVLLTNITLQSPSEDIRAREVASVFEEMIANAQ